MNQHFNYPAKFSKQKAGGYIVKFKDFAEAITEGDSFCNAMEQAIDCLEEAVANRIELQIEIPQPSELTKGYKNIPLTLRMSAKAALYLAVREKKMTKVYLAKLLHCDEKEVRRLLDPHYKSKLPSLEAALFVLGRRLSASVIGL